MRTVLRKQEHSTKAMAQQAADLRAQIAKGQPKRKWVAVRAVRSVRQPAREGLFFGE